MPWVWLCLRTSLKWSLMSSKTIRLVTDSTCDIPAELVARWHISIVPAFVNYGGHSYADDGVALDREAFYAQMSHLRPHPTTAAPPPAVAEPIVRQALAEADHVVILTAPANLSGIYNAVRLAASDLPSDRVTLLDSGMVSMGLGWQVLAAAEAAVTGDLSQVLATISQVRARSKVYAALYSIEYLRRSGRVGWAAASVGDLLQIKPIVSIGEGVVAQTARARTFSRALDKLDELARAETPLARLAILHANNLDGVQELRARLGDFAPPDTLNVLANPAIGAHIGPGSVGFAAVRA